MNTYLLSISPILVLFGSVAYVYNAAYKKDRQFPADNIGFWWLVFIALYSTLPAIAWYLKSGEYNPVFSQRLYRLQPSTTDVFDLLSIAASYAVGFTLVYSYLAKRAASIRSLRIATISNGKFVASVLVVLLAAAVGLVQNLSQTNTTYYGESFQQISTLPLGVRQFLKFVTGLGSVAGIVFLTGTLQRWPRYRFLVYLYVITLVLSYSPVGSRGEMFGGIFTLIILWHTINRPLRPRFWLVAGSLGMLLFMFLGILRGLLGQEMNYLDFVGRGLGEFDQLWANSVEIYQASSQQLIDIAPSIRFGELFAFIPSQFLPVEKQDLAGWFLDMYYPEYKAIGGGWAFGAITQAALGGGIVEAGIRGAILGLVFANTYLIYRNSRGSWWVFPSYIYIMVFSFNTVRNTTFWFLTGTVQILIPSLILIAILGAICAVKPRPVAVLQQ